MKSFFSTFGRLPYTWLNLGLILAVGMTQGIGLSLFVPLLEIMTSADGARSPLFDYLARFYGWFGIPFELPYLLGGIVVFIWTGFGLNFAQRVLLGRSQTHYVWRLRSKFVSGLMGSNWDHLAKQATGDNVNILISSIFRAGWGLANQVEVTASALLIVIFLSFGAVFSWPLLAATIGFGVLALLHHGDRYMETVGRKAQSVEAGVYRQRDRETVERPFRGCFAKVNKRDDQRE